MIDVEIRITDPALWNFGGPPKQGSQHAAAVDLVALGICETNQDYKPDLATRKPLVNGHVIQPGNMAYFCVGFSMHIKDTDYAAHIIPRSSSAALGIRLGNTQGLIDADYQGPIIVCLENRLSNRDVTINPGERIAQMYFARKVNALWNVVDEFTVETQRGSGAYGSTGRI